MSAVWSFLFAAGAVVVLTGEIFAIRVIGLRLQWSAEVQRKCVHVLVGIFAMFLPFVIPGQWPVVVLVILAIGAMLLLRWSKGPLIHAGAAIHSVERRSFGDIWLAVAVGFLFLRSGGSYILYGLPLAIITLSDAAAALAGSAYGRRRFVTEGGVKSWEGIVSFTMVGWVAAMSMLLLFSDTARGNVILLALVIAVFGAMVEAVSWRGLDNLFVPLAIHFFLRGFLDAQALPIALVAIAFLLGTALAQACAQKLRLAPHTARAFAVALFIVLGVGELYGAILPLIVMGCYLLTRSVLPNGGNHPDLDFLGTLCACAAIWLFIGETAGPTAIHHYNLAMGGFALAYVLMALHARKQMMWGMIATAGALFIVVTLAGLGLHRIGMPSYYEVVTALSFGIIWVAVMLVPDAFRRWRAPRSAALASLVPLIAYAFQVSVT